MSTNCWQIENINELNIGSKENLHTVVLVTVQPNKGSLFLYKIDKNWCCTGMLYLSLVFYPDIFNNQNK